MVDTLLQNTAELKIAADKEGNEQTKGEREREKRERIIVKEWIT